MLVDHLNRADLSREHLQRVFDEQIEKIFRVIDDQLQKLEISHPWEKVVGTKRYFPWCIASTNSIGLKSYLVMSGGLGSSPYLKQRLRKRYELGVGGGFPNAQELKILSAREPYVAIKSPLLD